MLWAQLLLGLPQQILPGGELQDRTLVVLMLAAQRGLHLQHLGVLLQQGRSVLHQHNLMQALLAHLPQKHPPLVPLQVATLHLTWAATQLLLRRDAAVQMLLTVCCLPES